MIVLDTNVLSAIMRERPDRKLSGWLNDLPARSIWITTITVYEVQHGIEVLPASARRRALEEAFALALSVDLEGRVLALDETGAREAAILSAKRQKAGRRGELRDTLIAGIAISRGAAVATRNTRHFEDLPVEVVDPWA
jgi:toxin FitB